VPAQWSSPVRYVECDQQGVVFNAHYLTWTDEASYDWWAAHGLPWEDLVARGIDPLVKATSRRPGGATPSRWTPRPSRWGAPA
jgi:acyl-CoA thioester hydrolase